MHDDDYVAQMRSLRSDVTAAVHIQLAYISRGSFRSSFPSASSTAPPRFIPLFFSQALRLLLLRRLHMVVILFLSYSVGIYFRPPYRPSFFSFPLFFLRYPPPPPPAAVSLPSLSSRTTQRGIRTLDFSTTKLENKRRNVSH